MISKYTENEFNAAKSRDKLPLQCSFCHSIFYRGKNVIQRVIKGNASKYDFCSSTCRGICDRKEDIPVVCANCGKKFGKRPSQYKENKNSFCSHRCSASYTNRHKKHGTRRSKLEKWLEEKLSIIYPDLEIHYSQKNAISSELDIYIPSLKLAFELNGIYHYEPIHGNEKLNQIQNNDNRKFQACLENNIELCIIDSSKETYFKESRSIKYLDIIKNIIEISANKQSHKNLTL